MKIKTKTKMKQLFIIFSILFTISTSNAQEIQKSNGLYFSPSIDVDFESKEDFIGAFGLGGNYFHNGLELGYNLMMQGYLNQEDDSELNLFRHQLYIEGNINDNGNESKSYFFFRAEVDKFYNWKDRNQFRYGLGLKRHLGYIGAVKFFASYPVRLSLTFKADIDPKKQNWSDLN